jgi:hypothetical protein
MLNTRKWILGLVLASFALQVSAKGPPKASTPEDKKFTGMVEQVTQRNCEICNCVEISITLKTATERLEVRLGPKSYFEEHDFALSKGDMIEIVGIRFKEAGKTVVLANEIRKGGDTLSLRGKFGRPAWLQQHGHTCPVCGN